MAVLSWREMSADNIRAARSLLREGRYCSSVSRSYYAAYCAATEEIRKRVTTFPYGRNNPPHEMVGHYLRHNTGLSATKKDNVIQLFDMLRIRRVDADYRPSDDVDTDGAKECLRDAMTIQIELCGYAV